MLFGSLKRCLVAAALSVSFSEEQLGEARECWSGVFSEDLCCDTDTYGPEGNVECWDEVYTYDVCCAREPASPQVEAADPTMHARSGGDLSQARSGGALAVSMRCWRAGFNFAFCCTRARPGGNPECWDGVDFTYEKCCQPPELLPAAFLFEDFDCYRDGSDWQLLRQQVENIVDAADIGRLQPLVEPRGGFLASARSLHRSLAGREEACPLGRVAVEATALLLCLGVATTASGCRGHWAATARAMRGDALSITQLSAATWPVLRVFRHIAAIVQQDDPSCASDGSTGVPWQLLHAEALAADQLSNRATSALYAMSGATDSFHAPCEGGHQWAATIKMNWCAKSEVKCALSYSMLLDWKMRRASASGRALRRWLERAGSWRLQDWQVHILASAMRHHYVLGLSTAELRALGPEPPAAGPRLCAELPLRGAAELLPPQEAGSGRLPETCRARCGASLDPEGRPWALSGALGARPALRCACAALGAPRAPGNCSREGRVLLRGMPAPRLAEDLLAEFLELGPEAPVFRQAAGSLRLLREGAPVFATMVFGHMARYLGRAFQNIERLEIPNVVVYVLDDGAAEACQSARSTLRGPHKPFCLRGVGKTALQKYIVVLAYVSLGLDVFWFDFDSVWLQNPLTALQSAEVHERGVRGASIYAAIDFDSKNCVMNAFFLIKASRATRTWLLALLHWVYKRPFVHDQVAFAQLLGIGPLIDQEPLPKIPVWSPLDPNVFANAARFSGLGFSSRVEDLVLFHFFDGWNSNMPDEVEQWATPVYRGVNLFEVLYGDDREAATAAMARSRLPPPTKLNDCSHMTSLGLGVDVQEGGRVALPAE